MSNCNFQNSQPQFIAITLLNKIITDNSANSSSIFLLACWYVDGGSIIFENPIYAIGEHLLAQVYIYTTRLNSLEKILYLTSE